MLCPIGKNALQRLKLSSQKCFSNGLWQQLLHPSHSLESQSHRKILGSTIAWVLPWEGLGKFLGILLCWEFLEGGKTKDPFHLKEGNCHSWDTLKV